MARKSRRISGEGPQTPAQRGLKDRDSLLLHEITERPGLLVLFARAAHVMRERGSQISDEQLRKMLCPRPPTVKSRALPCAAAAGDSDDVVDNDVVDADVVRRDPDPVYVDDPAVSAGVNAQRKRRLLQRARGHRSFRRERRDTATVATAAAARGPRMAAVVTRPLSVSQRWRNACWSDFGPKITSQHHRLRAAISKLWGIKRRLARRKTWAACTQRLGKLIEPPVTVAVATALISAGKFGKIHDDTTVSMLLRAIKAMGRMTRQTTQPVVSPPSPAPPASPTSESETESDSPSPRTKRVLERDQHASSRNARSQRRLGGGSSYGSLQRQLPSRKVLVYHIDTTPTQLSPEVRLGLLLVQVGVQRMEVNRRLKNCDGAASSEQSTS